MRYLRLNGRGAIGLKVVKLELRAGAELAGCARSELTAGSGVRMVKI
jgi:hypothetical protein